MRDVLEELLETPTEEDEGGILEQLLRRVAQTRPESIAAAQEPEQTASSAPVQSKEKGAGTLGEQEEPVQLWDEAVVQRTLEEEERAFRPKLAQFRQELPERRQNSGGTAEISAAQLAGMALTGEIARQMSSFPPLARQLEQNNRAAVRASAPAGGLASPARTEPALGQTDAAAAGGAREIDRAFERDARRYDSRFYLY